MHRIFIISLLLFSINISAQVISSVPQFPTVDDSIVVYFNTNEITGRGKELATYTGTVDVHTGLLTNKSIDEDDWKYVIAEWNQNLPKAQTVKESPGIYKLIIGNPSQYYNITNLPYDEKIVSLAFVLRAANRSIQTDNLYLEIFEEGINLKILEPVNLPIYPEAGETINFSAASENADSIAMFLNNQYLTSTINDTINYEITASGSGRQWIKFTVYSAEKTLSDSTHYFVREPVTITDLPEGVQAGINYINDNTVILVFFAPYKNFVYLIGDFNDWRFDPDINPDTDEAWLFDPQFYLKLTPDSTTYWTTITGLTPGQEYRFQYLVNGTLRIADPYSDKILEEEDSEISETTYPGLIPYPEDETSFSVSVFQTAEEEYHWEVLDFERPEKSELIIYELLVRDFVSTHDYRTLIDTLDYLENLGVNAIELMPVNEFENNESWGYSPTFYFAPDKYYGTKNDLKKFIDECHKRDIAVIMDIVLNHSYGESSFVRLYASSDFGPPTEENPWYNVEHNFQNPEAHWGNDFNHESLHTQKLVDRILSYWITNYKIDGFRFDFTKGFGNNIKYQNSDLWGSKYDADRIRLLKRMVNQMWSQDSTVYAIFEHLAEDSEERELANYGILMWGNMNYNYNEATMGYISNSNFNFISYKNRGFAFPHSVGYMESHDEERLMYKNLLYGNKNSDGSYNIKNKLEALQRIKLAAAFFFTVPGPKMIWQFGELGYDFSIDFNGRTANKPIKWDYYTDPPRNKLYKVFSELIKLRTNNEVFNTTDFSLWSADSVKRLQLKHETMDVIVLGNFDVVSKTSSPNFTKKGMWYNYFSGDSLIVTDTLMNVDLEPGEFFIYTSVKLSTPEEDILTDIGKVENNIPNEYELFQNYPNPFNPTTTISFLIPAVEVANFATSTLKVFDILGREVRTLVNENLQPGNYTVDFNASNLSSGVYFYKLTSGSFTQTKKMLLIK